MDKLEKVQQYLEKTIRSEKETREFVCNDPKFDEKTRESTIKSLKDAEQALQDLREYREESADGSKTLDARQKNAVAAVRFFIEHELDCYYARYYHTEINSIWVHLGEIHIDVDILCMGKLSKNMKFLVNGITDDPEFDPSTGETYYKLSAPPSRDHYKLSVQMPGDYYEQISVQDSSVRYFWIAFYEMGETDDFKKTPPINTY